MTKVSKRDAALAKIGVGLVLEMKRKLKAAEMDELGAASIVLNHINLGTGSMLMLSVPVPQRPSFALDFVDYISGELRQRMCHVAAKVDGMSNAEIKKLVDKEWPIVQRDYDIPDDPDLG